MRPIAVEPVQSRASARRAPAAFRLRLDDGRVLKARLMESRGHAERMAGVLDRLDHEAFLPILGRCGRAVLLDWVDAEAIPDRPGRSIIERCGALHASLHLVPLPGDGRLSIDDLPHHREKLDGDLQFLSERGAFAESAVRAMREDASRWRPSTCSVGFVHRDLCPENLVVRPDGRIIAIDNESVSLGAHDFDLARTWYRWPMEPGDRRLYLEAYARQRDVGAFLRHFPFWAIAVLADSARIRDGAAADVLSVPIVRLRDLLAALRRGVAAEELVFES